MACAIATQGVTANDAATTSASSCSDTQGILTNHRPGSIAGAPREPTAQFYLNIPIKTYISA